MSAGTRLLAGLHVPDGDVKMLVETLCLAQSAIAERARQGMDAARAPEHIARLQDLLDQCELHRPLGPDGKHGDRHTPTCGCDRG